MKKTLATLLVVALVASLCGVMFVSAEETNVALGKSWTTDADDADAGSSYVGNVTDGVIEPDGKYDTSLWFGADRRKTDDDAFAMIFDLEETYDSLTKVNLHVWPAHASGIVVPASIDVYVSADGETYTKVGSVTEFDGNAPQWVTVEFDAVAARYVKVDFVSSIEGDTGVFWFVSEIEIINSEAMVHEWLKIQLDGSEYYYNVDLTYDDPLYSDYGDMPDKVSHTYFLLSDELIQQIDHHDYEYINEAGDAYDGHNNLHDLTNPMFYANGDLYTLYVSDNTGYIATYDHADDNFTNKLTITDKWSADAYGAGATWNGNFSGIGEYGGLLYFNGDNCIYCYDPKTGVKTDYIETAMTDGRHLYGMYIQDGKIYGKASSDPNSDFDFVYVGDCISSYNVEVSDSIAHGTVAADKLAAAAGETVTLTVTPDEEFVVKQVTVNDAEITPTDGVYQFEMPSEDAYVSAEFDFADGMGAIAGYTLSLKGDIGVNFYMELADDVAGSDSAYMLFTVPNGDSAYEKSVKVSDAEKVTDENSVYYVFECGVFAKDMVSDIKARIVDGDTYGTEYSYSVEKYAKYILDHPEVDEYASAANMVKAMLNYGSYSQMFFNNNVMNLANASLDEDDKAIGDVTAALIDKSTFNEALPADVVFEGASLSLQSETTLSLYFKSDAILDFDCPNRVFETAVSGQYQVIRIRNISAKELGDDFMVSVSADDTQGTISYSPMNYCYNVLNNDAYADNTNLQNVVRSIYKYWQAAKYYFNYNI